MLQQNVKDDRHSELTAYHVPVLGVPHAEIMGLIGFPALAANVTSVPLLMRYKDRDANVRSFGSLSQRVR